MGGPLGGPEEFEAMQQAIWRCKWIEIPMNSRQIVNWMTTVNDCRHQKSWIYLIKLITEFSDQ